MNEYQLMELFALENDINLIDLVLMKSTSIPILACQKDEALLPSWIDFIYREIEHKKRHPPYSAAEDMLAAAASAHSQRAAASLAPAHDNAEFETSESFGAGLSVDLANILHGQDPSKCFIRYPKDPTSLPQRSALTDIEIFHLGLQIKYLPLYRLLQTSSKTVTTDHWQFARKEMKIFRVLNRFEHLRENGMTETCQHAYYSDKLARHSDRGTLSTMVHGRRHKAHWDFMLEEMEWMSVDFRCEREWKMRSARHIAALIQCRFEQRPPPALHAPDGRMEHYSMLPEPLLAFVRETFCTDKHAVEPFFFHNPKKMPWDPSAGLYGPPNPLKRERIDAEKGPFLQEPGLPKLPRAERSRALLPHGPFAQSLPAESQLAAAADMTDVHLRKVFKSASDPFLPPWSPLEDATLVYFIQRKLKSGDVNWPYVCEYLNTQYHHRQCIRYSESAKARFEKLAASGATMLSNDEQRGLSLKSHENLMYCFSMMKKRARAKSLVRIGMVHKKQLLSCHPSHEVTVKKAMTAFPRSLTPAELSLKKIQRVRMMMMSDNSQIQQPPQPQPLPLPLLQQQQQSQQLHHQQLAGQGMFARSPSVSTPTLGAGPGSSGSQLSSVAARAMSMPFQGPVQNIANVPITAGHPGMYAANAHMGPTQASSGTQVLGAAVAGNMQIQQSQQQQSGQMIYAMPPSGANSQGYPGQAAYAAASGFYGNAATTAAARPIPQQMAFLGRPSPSVPAAAAAAAAQGSPGMRMMGPANPSGTIAAGVQGYPIRPPASANMAAAMGMHMGRPMSAPGPANAVVRPSNFASAVNLADANGSVYAIYQQGASVAGPSVAMPPSSGPNPQAGAPFYYAGNQQTQPQPPQAQQTGMASPSMTSPGFYHPSAGPMSPIPGAGPAGLGIGLSGTVPAAQSGAVHHHPHHPLPLQPQPQQYMSDPLTGSHLPGPSHSPRLVNPIAPSASSSSPKIEMPPAS